MNKRDYELLTSVFQNCRTAITSIQDIEPSVEDGNLRDELREELENYRNFAKKCESYLTGAEEELPDNNFIEKAKLWTSIKMTTIMDKSTRHLAEMLLLGSFMGYLTCIKDQADHKNISSELDEILENLKAFQKSNIETLIPYLS